MIRQLKQDVSAFWRNMDKAKNDFLDETGGPATAMVGPEMRRENAGEMLIPGGSVVGNDGFLAKDRSGFGCPVTSRTAGQSAG